MAIAATTPQFNYSLVKATATAANGDVYLAGSFVTTVRFDNITLNSPGYGPDIFIAKWSRTTGHFVWAQQAGGISNDEVTALAVSGTSLYISGTLTSGVPATFGSIVLPMDPTVIGGFLAKLVDAGSTSSFSWAHRTKTMTALATSGTNLYATGEFRGTYQFGPTTLTSVAFSGDIFMLKLQDTGAGYTVIWAQQAGGTSDETSKALAVSGTSVYVAGTFYGYSATFGGTILTSAGGGDAYVAKLTDAGSTGSFVWAQSVRGNGNDVAYALAIQGTNIYMAGSFEGFSTQAGSTVLTNAGGAFIKDVFVAKLTDAGSAGSFVWAQRAGGQGDDCAQALLVDGSDVYLMGYFDGWTTTFGPVTIVNNSTAYTDDIFVAKLTDTGANSTYAWAQGAGGTGNDQTTAACLFNGTVYVGGYVTETATFGSHNIVSPPNSSVACLASFSGVPLVSATASLGLLMGLSLYPNPAHATTTLQLPPVPGAPQATLTLLDALGRAVRTATVALPPADLRHELDLTGLPAGIYAVQVAAGTHTATRRLVVQ